MHGSSAGLPIPLTTWGGLVTLASPDSLPDGASPRCYDNDYLVGSTGTRAGLTGAYTFAGNALSPAGSSAVDVSLGGVAWSNPANILSPSLFATANLPGTGSANIATVQVTAGHRTPDFLFVTFAAPPPAALIPYTFSGLTTFTELNRQTLTPVAVSGSTAQFLYGFGHSNYGPAADTGSASLAVNLTDAIDVTHFGLSVPPTSTPQGFHINVEGGSTGAATLTVQMLKAGVPVGAPSSIAMDAGSTLNFGAANDLFGEPWAYSDLNSTTFGVRFTVTAPGTASVQLGRMQLTVYLLPSQVNFQFITTFTDQKGAVKNISLDAAGNLWVEDVTNAPGVLSLATENLAPNAHACGVQGEGVEYLAFNDGTQGIDVPRQYTGQWIDRITQVGPGAPPVFTPQVAIADTYAIATITQPAQMSDPADPGHFQALLWSSGPGSATAGNVVTVYYALKTGVTGGQDTSLTAAVNSGEAVYVYISSAPFGNGTFQVTSVGSAIPPHGSGVRWYFTYQVPTSNYQFYGGPDDAAGYYQRTLATMTMSVAVPGLTVGNQVLIAGTTTADYNTTWPIAQTVNSGEMAITSTAVSGGVATYSYSLSTGVAPAAGQLVTVSGTTNANGALNVVNATIATATGGSTGSFTINLGIANATTAAEQGQATTAGTVFAFDPGILTLGTLTSPIYTASTGGTLTFGGSGQFIGPGTRQGTVFFITRNGYYTAPAPPLTFTCPNNTTAINATAIPLGPPNVIARGVAFTEPGQNGVPGANFFNIPTDVQYTVNNVSYTATSLIINDNTTTSASFVFTDFVLLNARAIDIYGFNLFNQIEIGNPGWITAYSTRNFYGLCQNKVQNFNNLSFDGGYLSSAAPTPLGWTMPDAYGSLLASPVFGNSYYVKNTSGGTLAVAGLISQTAYQDAYQQPIINANTVYSVRVTARCPSGLTTGNLVIALTVNGVAYGSFAIAFASMTTAMQVYSGYLNVPFATVPANLQIEVSATAIGDGADVEIDRIEPYPTNIPILGTTVYGSYAGLPEQVDGVTGQGKFTSENQQPVNGGLVMYDTFYGLKGQGPNASMYSWQASANLEPAQWEEPEVAQRAGACGPMAFDFGEQWLVTACRNGVYLYEGGQPGKIMQEIYQIWDAINWKAATSIWLRIDTTSRRIFVGVPLPTPNFWLPNAPVNANPTSPNVILMCNYQALDTGQEIKNAPQMHTTMFGALNAIDMRRKWTIWRIPSPYGSVVTTAADKAFYLCNGLGNSKVYALDDTATADDGVAIDSLYTTAALGNSKEAMQALGAARKRTGYMTLNASGAGNLTVRFLPNQVVQTEPAGYNPWTVPGGFNLTPVCLNDREASVNFCATRTFVELSGADFNASAMTLSMKRDVWNQLTGQK